MFACLVEVCVICNYVYTILTSITLTYAMHTPPDCLILHMHALHLVQVAYHVYDAWSLSNAWPYFGTIYSCTYIRFFAKLPIRHEALGPEKQLYLLL